MIKNFLKLEKVLSSEQKMIIESTKAFANQYLKPRIINDYKNEIVDKSIFKEMGQMGILGPTIKGYNCLGSSYLTYGLIAKEIEAIDSGYRSMFSVQSSLVMNPINKFGTEYQKNKYLPELASGNMIGCFGLTEPDHGSNPAGMVTYAQKDGNNYILNGSKTWISNSPIADLFLVWAKDKSDNNKIKGFLIEKDAEGLTAPKIDGKLSLRASVTGMIMLDEVKIPKDNILRVEGLKGPFTCLNDARLGISFGTLGAAESCIDQVIDYTTQRKQFDQFLAEKQLIQLKVADMITEYNLALAVCYQIAQLKDQGESIPEMISMIKRNSCQKSLDIARKSRDILGGNGISEEYNVFRHLTNLETVNTYEGTADIHALILEKFFTGFSSF